MQRPFALVAQCLVVQQSVPVYLEWDCWERAVFSDKYDADVSVAFESIWHVECLAAQDHRNKSLERDSGGTAETHGFPETDVIDSTFHSYCNISFMHCAHNCIEWLTAKGSCQQQL